MSNSNIDILLDKDRNQYAMENTSNIELIRGRILKKGELCNMYIALRMRMNNDDFGFCPFWCAFSTQRVSVVTLVFSDINKTLPSRLSSEGIIKCDDVSHYLQQSHARFQQNPIGLVIVRDNTI